MINAREDLPGGNHRPHLPMQETRRGLDPWIDPPGIEVATWTIACFENHHRGVIASGNCGSYKKLI